jgi:hypothetical protein
MTDETIRKTDDEQGKDESRIPPLSSFQLNAASVEGIVHVMKTKKKEALKLK